MSSRSRDDKPTLRRRADLVRFAAICAIFIGSQLLILLMSLAAVEVIDVARAYVGVEALYSKAQKTAVLDLHRYAETDAAADFARFTAALMIPDGDHAARAALEEPQPRRDAAYAGFLAGGNHPSDIRGLIDAFLWLRDWDLFAAAVDDWRASDLLMLKLRSIGAGLHDAITARAAPPRRATLLAAADALDARLTELENSFALHMGDAARLARTLAILSLGIGSLVLWTVGVRLVWKVYRKGHEVERRLMASEQRFRDYAEVASDWFWEMDADLRFTYLSERFSEVTGAPAVTLLGKTPLDPHRGGGVDSAWGSRLSDLAARREFRGLRYRYAGDPAGEKVWSISGKPIFDERRRFCGYRGTGSDVTAEVQAREALKHAKERAEAASRAKSDFLANMSHELRTPLNAIIGFSEVIETQVFGPIENQRYIGYAADVHGAGQHLLALINDILDLSKIEAGKGEIDESAVDIGGVVDWAVNLTRERMQNHGLRCSVAGRAGAPMVHADERRMKQILVNLLSNAIKFTPPGGTVSIAVACDAERGLSVSIADTGIGIAAEDIPRALAPFDQIDSGMNRRVEGTGLGLSLTKSIVELHHGTLVIESAVGVGTTVTVVLPPSRVLAQQPPAPQRRNAAA